MILTLSRHLPVFIVFKCKLHNIAYKKKPHTHTHGLINIVQIYNNSFLILNVNL